MDSSNQIIDEAIAANQQLPGALLPVLHAIQDALGFIPPDAVPRVARALNLSQADVYGVITFYHDFRSSPPGRHVLKLCRAEACQAMGSDALAEHLKHRLGIEKRGASAHRSAGGEGARPLSTDGHTDGAHGGSGASTEFRHTTADGALTVEPVYCLGNCALSPAVMLDGRLRGRITAEVLDRMIDACRREEGA
jgi:formate dehydrogenase subunit gamma